MEIHQFDLIQCCLFAFSTSVMFLITSIVYNLYWHPLSKYSGPRLWAAFRFPYCVSLFRGEYVHDIRRFHEKYGEVVRIAPNELSFADVQAWKDIYCARPGHHRFPKNPIWWGEHPNRVPSIVTASDQAAHERMRKILSQCFSIKALRGQEATVQRHATLMVEIFRERMGKSHATQVNIIDWYMFFTFDVLGELCLGESFNCLTQNRFRRWILTISNYYQIAAYIGILRLYTSQHIDKLLLKCVPKRMQEIHEESYSWAVEKVHRRLNLETQVDDFMTEILRHDNEFGMSIPEIENNTNILTVAGSDTCGTVLSGITNYLMKYHDAYRNITDEIRTVFKKEEDITFASLAPLPYLNAVIEEGLRMCPPNASGLGHVVPSGGDTVCGKWLPEGTCVAVHQESLHRSRRLFHCPDDFLPERWLPQSRLDSTSPFYNDDLAAVQAFGIGMWSCIGKNLAYGEMRLILARLVWNFDLSIAPGGQHVDWTSQKCWFVTHREPLDLVIVDARQAAET